MKHLPTTVLLDLADDYNRFAKKFAAVDESSRRHLATKEKLASIDTELLSRMPEFTYITVLDDSGNPIGFEPYIPVDIEFSKYLSFEIHVYECIERLEPGEDGLLKKEIG